MHQCRSWGGPGFIKRDAPRKPLQRSSNRRRPYQPSGAFRSRPAFRPRTNHTKRRLAAGCHEFMRLPCQVCISLPRILVSWLPWPDPEEDMLPVPPCAPWGAWARQSTPCDRKLPSLDRPRQNRPTPPYFLSPSLRTWWVDLELRRIKPLRFSLFALKLASNPTPGLVPSRSTAFLTPALCGTVSSYRLRHYTRSRFLIAKCQPLRRGTYCKDASTTKMNIKAPSSLLLRPHPTRMRSYPPRACYLPSLVLQTAAVLPLFQLLHQTHQLISLPLTSQPFPPSPSLNRPPPSHKPTPPSTSTHPAPPPSSSPP